MAQLSSPGVAVTVNDESFYTPAAPGTVPLIVVASAENKANSAGTGIAPGTLKANAGKVYLLTSQMDLGTTFGIPYFQTDASNNPVHAGEINEYGLQAAYSFLGVSNRAYVVRADLDLGQLAASALEPIGDPVDGTLWLDTNVSKFGIFEWDARPASAGGQVFVNKVPMVITDETKLDGGAPRISVGAIGDYAIVAVTATYTLWTKTADGWLAVGGSNWTNQGLTPLEFAVGPHTSVPQWKATAGDAPSGSVWIKTTTPNLGARYDVKSYNANTGLWVDSTSPLFETSAKANVGLDTAGGSHITGGTTYVKYTVDQLNGISFKVYTRRRTGTTTVSSVLTLPTLGEGASFTIAESKLDGTMSAAASVVYSSNVQTLADNIGTSIVQQGLQYTVVDVVNGRVVIQHILGGDLEIVSASVAQIFEANSTFYSTGTNTYTASLWTAATVNVGAEAPVGPVADGRLWYNSTVDEVDILIHNGTSWVGYQHTSSPYVGTADVNGPIVSATEPTTQSNGESALVEGDLWVSTADMENFPMIYRFNGAKWVLIDNSDQTTENGILFHDARWGTSGADTAPATIASLLTSDYLDFDAPDPALYPQGMLLWNLRRSGNNVVKYVKNYVDVNANNVRFGNELMSNYAPDRWVSQAPNKENGAGQFGRKAQRAVVLTALNALINENIQIRDEDSRQFNLMSCPGYLETLPALNALNADRGLMSFIVADTPARLSPDATTLSNWGNNVAGATGDGEDGLVSTDPYSAVYYPWGYTTDLLGNNIVVPPSHIMLRTIALSDNVSYPWFAPAGTRRGGVNNASSVGYVNPATGEFETVALNNGQRDTLASIHVNPITYIGGIGLVAYGQKTRQLAASSLDRINVARLVIYLRYQLNQIAKPYIFEPNDTITRNEIKQQIESMMLELTGQRALYDYLVVCDTSNNTPARIDRSELHVDIAIEPVKAVEFIYIPLRLENTGAIKGLGK